MRFPFSLRSSLRPAGIAVAGTLLALLVGWGAVFERIRHDRKEAIDDALRQTSNLALAFEEQTVRMLQTADKALRFLKHEYEQRARVTPGRMFDGGISDPAPVSFLGTVDENGALFIHGDGYAASIDVSDREYFRYHRDTPDKGLRIGEPFVGRVSGVTEIPLSRRLDKRDGSFGGVVVAGIPANYFSAFYSRLDLGAAGVVQLVHRDGILLSRRDGEGASSGIDMGDSLLLRHAGERRIGSFISRGRRDGQPRYQSYRALEDYSLIISVGVSSEEALRHARVNALHYIAGGIAATLGALLFGYAVLAAQRRGQLAHAALEHSEARYRATFDQAAVGVCHCAPDGRFLKVNGKYCEMLGYTESELLARRFHEIVHPDDLAEAEGVRKRFVEEGDGLQPPLEHREVRKGAGFIWTSVAVNLVRDAQGAPEYFVAVIQDVTARKSAEARLHEQLDELRRFQRITVDRELRMQELETQMRALAGRIAA